MNTKELRVRMLAKTERHRISRIAWRKFLRRNPEWENNTARSIERARSIRAFRSSQPVHPVMATIGKPSLVHVLKNTLQSIFRRKAK